ncbi:MAG: hypothetical protein ACPLTR_08720 [Thermacetogeniaceae bacterium]
MEEKRFIPPDVISYYKQFGLSEEEIEMFFQMRPSADASHQPTDLLKDLPKAGG